jgi:HAD superfamily hydrolase (TIGR01509 family)
MARQLTHVIFDCDGVLVDSEMLSAGVLMEMMAEVGLPLDFEQFRSDFLGRSFANAAERAEIRFGRPLPRDFQLRYRDRLLSRMAAELTPMEGVFAVLDHLRVPYALATSSSPQRLALSLKVTGLAPYFAGKAYTASEVRAGKPAPDLYLYAAEKLGAEPACCLALEDSEMGIRAGKAALMETWHFAGGAHVKAGYRLPEGLVPDRRIDSMADLRQAFRGLGLCA